MLATQRYTCMNLGYYWYLIELYFCIVYIYFSWAWSHLPIYSYNCCKQDRIIINVKSENILIAYIYNIYRIVYYTSSSKWCHIWYYEMSRFSLKVIVKYQIFNIKKTQTKVKTQKTKFLLRNWVHKIGSSALFPCNRFFFIFKYWYYFSFGLTQIEHDRAYRYNT